MEIGKVYSELESTFTFKNIYIVTALFRTKRISRARSGHWSSVQTPPINKRKDLSHVPEPSGATPHLDPLTPRWGSFYNTHFHNTTLMFKEKEQQ